MASIAKIYFLSWLQVPRVTAGPFVEQVSTTISMVTRVLGYTNWLRRTIAVDVVIVIANRSAFIIVGGTPIVADSVFNESVAASFIEINPNIYRGSLKTSCSFGHRTVVGIGAIVSGFEVQWVFTTIVAIVTNRTKPADTSSIIVVTITFGPNSDPITGIAGSAFATVIGFTPIATIIVVRFTFVAGVVSEFTATL